HHMPGYLRQEPPCLSVDERLLAGRPDDVTKHGARLDRGKLPGVAYKNEPGVLADRFDEPGHERERDHRGLVHDHHVMRQPLAAVMAEAAVAVRAPAEKPVQRRRL